MKRPTPFAYAKAEYLAGRFPAIVVLALADKFAFVDGDFEYLEHPHFADADAARKKRSEILDRARKASGV